MDLCKKGTGKNQSGQRKPRDFSRLAAIGAYGPVNGKVRSPNPPNTVVVKHKVLADDSEILSLGLRDQHAIEGIFVWARKGSGPDSVFDANCQTPETRLL
jgi:hypothetical protein